MKWTTLILALALGGAAMGGEWTQIESPATQRLRDAAFVGADQGWIVGDAGTMLHTSDGGLTWQTQTSGNTAMLLDVRFRDANTGWAVGFDPSAGG